MKAGDEASQTANLAPESQSPLSLNLIEYSPLERGSLDLALLDFDVPWPC